MSRTRKANAKQLTEELNQKISNFRDSDEMKEHLSFLGCFRNLSWSNRMRLAMTFGNAPTAVATYKQWQQRHGRQVQKGQRGCKLIGMGTYKEKDKDGNSTDEQGVYFFPYTVFTLGQTSEMSPEEIIKAGIDTDSITPAKVISIETTGGSAEMADKVIHGMKADGIDVQRVEGLYAYGVSSMGKVELRDNMNASMEISVGIHEWAHELIHGYEERVNSHEHQKEFEAEATAYVVCQYFELPIKSEVYLQGYSDYDMVSAMPKIAKAADYIINSLS